MPELFFPSLKPRFVNSQEVIREFRRIALKLAGRNRNIEEVYLFGSYAQGNAGARSDVDILIVLSKDRRGIMDRLDEFILEFSKGPVPADVLVYTRIELDRAIKEGNHFLDRAVRGLKLLTEDNIFDRTILRERR